MFLNRSLLVFKAIRHDRECQTTRLVFQKLLRTWTCFSASWNQLVLKFQNTHRQPKLLSSSLIHVCLFEWVQIVFSEFIGILINSDSFQYSWIYIKMLKILLEWVFFYKFSGKIFVKYFCKIKLLLLFIKSSKIIASFV